MESAAAQARILISSEVVNIPNWAESDLTVKGKKDELNKFRESGSIIEKYKYL